jgi:hemolysin activation/secretion protein
MARSIGNGTAWPVICVLLAMTAASGTAGAQSATVAAGKPDEPRAEADQAGGSAAAQPGASAADNATQAYFDIHEYRVLGNAVLSNLDIERVLYPLLGDHKTIADVEVARTALEKAYHDRGYATVFVDIPEQEVEDAIVRLRVTEGKLRQVSIGGARYFSERKILAALPAVKAGSVPLVPDLQRQLADLNAQTADRLVVPVLKAGPTPGTVDLALNVKDNLPLHGSLDVNNQYSPDTKPLRATVSLSYNNLFQRLDSVSAQYQDSPQSPGEVGVFAANYAPGALASGLRPSAYYIHSNSDVAAIGTLGVLGKGDILGLRFNYPVDEETGMLQSLVYGADYKHFRDTIGLQSTPALITPISYVNLTAGYSGNWSGKILQDILSFSADFGPRGLPNYAGTFANKRFEGRPNYFYVRFDESLIIKLPAGFHVQMRAAGQLAVEPLISNEDYSIAGIDGVRGYLEAEVLGDKAVKGTLQFGSPSLTVRAVPLFDGFVFLDAARAYLIDPLANETPVTTLRSWGFGLDILPGRFVSGYLTWSDPLAAGPRTPRGDSRLLFDLRASF